MSLRLEREIVVLSKDYSLETLLHGVASVLKISLEEKKTDVLNVAFLLLDVIFYKLKRKHISKIHIDDDLEDELFCKINVLLRAVQEVLKPEEYQDDLQII